MPFTVSHVAAVLPAHRLLARAHLFTAAVIGSMVPDFRILLPGVARWQTHSVVGLFDFCLPVGLMAYWLTQYLIKPALMQIVSDRVYVRLRAEESTAPPWDLRHWFLATLTILLAAITHLIWDGFTHENARGVRMFPVLDFYGPEMNGHALHLYRWLQYGSSIFGLLAVLVALLLWLRHAPPPLERPLRPLRDTERRAWIGLYIAVSLLSPAVAAIWQIRSTGPAWLATGPGIEEVAVAALRGSAASLLLGSVLLRARLELLRPSLRS